MFIIELVQFVWRAGKLPCCAGTSCFNCGSCGDCKSLKGLFVDSQCSRMGGAVDRQPCAHVSSQWLQRGGKCPRTALSVDSESVQGGSHCAIKVIDSKTFCWARRNPLSVMLSDSALKKPIIVIVYTRRRFCELRKRS